MFSTLFSLSEFTAGPKPTGVSTNCISILGRRKKGIQNAKDDWK